MTITEIPMGFLSLQAKAMTVLHIRPQLLPSTSLLIHYSLIIPPFEATQCELMTVLYTMINDVLTGT
jgi:hypothetical protein